MCTETKLVRYNPAVPIPKLLEMQKLERQERKKKKLDTCSDHIKTLKILLFFFFFSYENGMKRKKKITKLPPGQFADL